jgi:hypothetical protein
VDLVVGSADDDLGGPGSGSLHLLFGPFPGERVTSVYGEGEERQREDGVSVHRSQLGAAVAAGHADDDAVPELLVGAPGWSNDYSELRCGAYVLDGGGW